MTGSSLYINQYVTTLIENKVEVHIIARRNDEMSVYFSSKGACLHCCDISFNLKVASYDIKYKSHGYMIKDIFKFIVGFFVSLFYLLQIKPSIVVIGDIVRPQSILAAKILNKYIVTLVQCTPSQGKVKKIFLKKIMRLSDKIVGITKHHISLFGSLDDVTKLVIPNTITDSNSEVNDAANSLIFSNYISGKFVISCFSGIQEDKGSFEFIKAAHNVLQKRQDITFILAGKFSKQYSTQFATGTANHDSYNEKVFNYVHEHKLTDKILIIGEINYVSKLIQLSDVIVSLHISPHFSRPIIEAFSEKKAVVAADDSFNRDIIENGRNGYLIDPCDINQFTKTMDIILSDEKYKELGEKGYNTYLQTFSKDIVTDSISQIICDQKTTVYILAQERIPANINRQISILSNIVNHVWNEAIVKYIFALNSDQVKHVVVKSDKLQIVPSSNDNWEFSAYDTAYKYLVKHFDVSDNDIIIIANETIYRDYNDTYNKLFLNKKIKKWVQKGYIVGLKGYLPGRLKIFDLFVNNTVSTHLFILKFGMLKNIVPFSLQYGDKCLFSSDEKKLFVDNDLIDSQIVKRILSRITIESDDNDANISFIKHHNAMSLTSDNKSYVIGKAKAILAEYYFGAKASSNKITIKNLKRFPIFRSVIAHVIHYTFFKRLLLYMIKIKIIDHTPRTGKYALMLRKITKK